MEKVTDELLNSVRKKITARVTSSDEIDTVFTKVKNGTATYADGDTFAHEMGRILSETFKELDVEGLDPEGLAYDILGNALETGYQLNTIVCSSIQQDLNELAGIGLNPVEPELNRQRMEDLQDAIVQAPPEERAKLLDEPLTNISVSHVDDWVETNASYQKSAGLSPIIRREYEGSHFDPHRKGGAGFTDCKYCKTLAGEWQYGDEPKDVYKRHEGCRCKVQYFPNKKAKGRITALAKGQTDTKKELYNTGNYTSTSRKAELARRRKLYGKDEARKILNQEWKGGLNGVAERHYT